MRVDMERKLAVKRRRITAGVGPLCVAMCCDNAIVVSSCRLLGVKLLKHIAASFAADGNYYYY